MTHNYVNEFQDSMNEHANAEYKAIPPYVLELERHRNMKDNVRGCLKIWRRPSNNPRENEWGLKMRKWGEWEEMKEMFDAVRDESIEEFIEE